MHFINLLQAKIFKLRKTNHPLSKRRKTKKKHIY